MFIYLILYLLTKLIQWINQTYTYTLDLVDNDRFVVAGGWAFSSLNPKFITLGNEERLPFSPIWTPNSRKWKKWVKRLKKGNYIPFISFLCVGWVGNKRSATNEDVGKLFYCF